MNSILRCTNCGCVLDDNLLVNNMEFTGNGEGSSYALFLFFLIIDLLDKLSVKMDRLPSHQHQEDIRILYYFVLM